MNHVSMLICKNLNFNMSWILHEMFNVHLIITECLAGFFLSGQKFLYKFFFGICHTHSFSAATKNGFDDYRKSNFLCDGQGPVFIGQCFLTARNHRNPCLNHRGSRHRFIAKFGDCLGIRSDKCDVAGFTKCRKTTILREKTKPGMNGICSGHHRRTDNLFHIQITVLGRCRSDTDRLIC